MAVVIILVASIIFAPIVPISLNDTDAHAASLAASGSPKTSSTSVALGVSTMSDPSGSYEFQYLGNNTYSMDLATYERLLNDPYAGIGGTIEIINNTVIETMLSTVNDTYGPGFVAASPTAHGFASVAFWLFGFGCFCSGGIYSFSGIN